MVILRNVLIHNFLSIAEATLRLDDQGLVLIEGVNLDDPTASSNGSGKSSIVDAISWCLYGETARGATGDAVVNLKAGKGTFVEIDLLIDGVPHTIARGRKHKTLKNRVQLRQGVHDLTLGTDKMTQERINNLLGCGVETFNAAIYMGQENMRDLPSMTDKALKAVLEEALSLDKLDAALDIAVRELRAKEDQLDKIEVRDIALRREHAHLVDQETVLDRTLKGLKDVITGLQDDLKIEATKFKEQCEQLDDEITTFNKAAARAPTTRPDHAANAAARHAAEVQPLEDRIANMEKKSMGLAYDRQDVMRQIKALQEHDCVACGRPLGDEDHSAEIADLEKQAADLMAKRDAMIADIRDLKAHMQATAAVIAEDLAKAIAADRSTKTRADYLALVAEVTKKKESVQQDFKHQYDRWSRLINTNRDRVGDTLKSIAANRAAKDETVEAMFALKSKQRDVEAEIEILSKVKYALGRKGFRGEVLDQVTPYLNARTQHYLEALTEGNIEAVWETITQNADGDYVENFHIKVAHKSGVDRFANLSGGEKRKVRLATALALQDLVATRAVKPIKLFIADEIDDAIDTSGLELLMGVLESKARDMGSVFVISHNDLSDWCRNKITVTKRDGVSTFDKP